MLTTFEIGIDHDYDVVKAPPVFQRLFSESRTSELA
jgi:hypothetical protein